MINRKNTRFIVTSIFLIIGIDLCLVTSPVGFLGTQFISKKSHDSEFAKIKSSNQGYIDYNEQKLFWFIQITDTQFVWATNESIAIFNQFLNETFQEIAPLFIYNTGDLVDANNGAQQDVEEWKLYKKALEENNMNSSIYVDLIGNHDAANDPEFSHYLNYSMIGRNFKTLQYSFNKSFSFGNYAFIGINTAKNSYDLYEFALLGFLNTTELDWYEKELEKYGNYDRIFVFGHHPHMNLSPFQIISNLSSSGKTFFDLNEEFNVSYYIAGHVHFNSFHKEDNFLSMTTSNFILNGGTYRIISLDHDQLSTSIEIVGKWPQAIITYPSIENAIIQDFYKIRVLAWDTKGIDSVEFSLHSVRNNFQITEWKPLINIITGEPLWEGDLGVQLNGKYLLKGRIKGGSGEVVKEIIFISKNSWNYEFLIVLIFTMIALISISIISLYYSRNHINKLKITKEL